MKGIRYFAGIIFVLVLLMSSTWSFAGTIQLPQTGQTTCYSASGTSITCSGTGQDGNLRAGVAWPDPRFTDNGDQTVRDNLTGLIWAKNGNVMMTRNPGFDNDSTSGDGLVTWQHALDYINKLNQERYLGYNDWRLPNVVEMESIFDAEQANCSTTLNGKGFVNVQASSYWSSSTSISSKGNAWIVDMIAGNVSFSIKSNFFYAWPVRSIQSVSSIISLPKTGQTTCYNASGGTIDCLGTGQDGELQIGAVWPNPRFTERDDQTVKDNLTGLIWAKDAYSPGISTCAQDSTDSVNAWQGALDYVKCLNTNNYLEHNDWRLPNRKELRSVVHDGQSSSADWLNTQGFYGVQSFYYWTSSTYAYSAWDAWMVMFQMYDGDLVTFGKSYGLYVWPVRSEQPVSFASLVASKLGSGTVTSPSGDINCGSSCKASYTIGTSVTLTAVPDTNYTFAGWSGGGCNGNGTCIVTMDASKSVIAAFNPPPVANCGANQIVFNSVTLDGSASQGNITSWNWTLTHQTNSAYNRTATGVNPTLSDLSPGYYDVTLTVGDNGGATSSASMILAVVPGNVVNDIRSGWYTEEQLNQAVSTANAAKDLIIDQKDQTISALNTTIEQKNQTIASMYTKQQLDQAVTEERLKWDVNSDGKMGLEEVIYILQIISGAR